MVGYGLTESSPTTHITPIRKIKVGSIGVPLSLTEDRIVDPGNGDRIAAAGDRRTLGPGTAGDERILQQ